MLSRLFICCFKSASKALLVLFAVGVVQVSVAESLGLQEAIEQAQKNDPWLERNQYQQDALSFKSISAATLPDPQISLTMANLPTDGFDFNQEAMTQLKVGLSQRFARGDSLNIKQRQLQLLASQHPYQRQDRQARVAVIVSHHWLDAYQSQESINLIEKNRALFEQLADVAQASYSSALGKTRQQDIIRAQLELTLLQDRLTVLKQQQETHIFKLSEWLGKKNNYAETLQYPINYRLPSKLPAITLFNSQLYKEGANNTDQTLYNHFLPHASVRALQQKIKASSEAIMLAKQKYKPEWGINASYAYRDENPMGNERADLFSIGLSFDVPLFSGNRQDKEVQAAVSSAESVKTEQWILIRKMIASFESYRAQLLRLNQRQTLYQQQLLPQVHEQAEASLTAYTNDDGDFSEVVRARIAELNAEIDSLNIQVKRQKLIAQLNYFFTLESELNTANTGYRS